MTTAVVASSRRSAATTLSVAMLLLGVAIGAAAPRSAIPATAIALALAVGLRSWHKP